MQMTRETLRDLCTQHKLYRTAHLNDKLYLNFKGFTQIENLEEYINLKAIFLEGNALQSLEGIPPLEQLKCLYVHQNCLRTLHGLEHLPNLDTLNVSSNGLDTLQQLQHVPQLATLIAEHNHLSTLQALSPLQFCSNLHTLDLQSNNIEDPEVIDIMAGLPELRCLYLKGNPVVSKLPNYRKTLISRCKQLTYLDERPVSEEERKCCEAWAAGGLEAERAERNKLKEEAAARERRNFEWMQRLRAEGYRKRRAMLGLPDGDTDPLLDTLASDQGHTDGNGSGADGDDHDEDLECLREPPELQAARTALAAYSARPGEDEPSELSRTRQQLVQQGKDIKQASWSAAGSGKSEVAAVQQDDGMVYLASVKASQQELDDACGAAVVIAPSSTVAASAAEAEAMQGRYDFAKLREATAAAKAAGGVSETLCSSATSTTSNSHSNGKTPETSEVEPEPLLPTPAIGRAPFERSGASIGAVLHHVQSHPVEVDEAQLTAESSESLPAARGETIEALDDGVVSLEDVVVLTDPPAHLQDAGAVQAAAQVTELYDLD
eukprot:gene5377-5612_t